MSSSPGEGASPITVVVLDTAGGGALAAMVRSAGMAPHKVEDLDAFKSVLRRRVCRVGISAFEALNPEPQSVLHEIRESAPDARIVVVNSEGSPRTRLAQRLWSIGAIDHLLSRSSSRDAIRQVLRQAWADAFVLEAEAEASSPEGLRFSHIRLLQSLAAAFANHRHVEELLRELQRGLPNVLDYMVLQVMVLEQKPKIYVFQRLPVQHDRIWGLARNMCNVVNPIAGGVIEVESLDFVDGAPIIHELNFGSARDQDGGDGVFTTPMIVCGEVIGCIGIMAPATVVSNGDNRQIIRLIAHQLATSLRHVQMLESAQEASLTDPLTGVYNRRYLEDVLEREWERVHRYDRQLSMAMLDIDHFKRFNDQHGHLVGDSILQNLALVLKRHLRKTDHVVRYGGEEFLLVLPETNTGGAAQVIERIRVSLSTGPIGASEIGQPLSVTVSVGIASYPSCAAKSGQELVLLADRALFSAKRSGRDRVCVAGIPSQSAGQPALWAQPQGAESRQNPRVPCDLPAVFVPIPEIVDKQAIRVSSVNISQGGIALRDPDRQFKRNMMGLVYLDDRPHPILARVVWAGLKDGEWIGGLKMIRNTDLFADHMRPLSPRQRSALLVAENQGTAAVVRRVLRSNGYEVRLLNSESVDTIDESTLDECTLAVIGESDLRRDVGRKLFEARKRSKNPLRVIVINEEADRHKAIQMISSQKVEHFIPRERHAEEALFATLSKLMSDDYFGVRPYLLAGAETKTWTVVDAEEKGSVLTGIRSFAEEVDCHPRMLDLLISAVDEILVYALYREVATSADGGGPARNSVSVECGCDGRLLCVGVVDEHGRFKVEDVYEGLAQAMAHEQDGFPESVDSARLGFRIMLSALSQVAINVAPENRTEIIAVIDLRKSLREHRSLAPGLGVFHKPM